MKKPVVPFARAALACLLAAAALPCFASASSSRWVSHPDQPFDILATEATVREFKDCLAAQRCNGANADDSCNLSDPGRDQHPINCIDYDGAAALCGYLGGRLCSSKEWLAACRGTEQRAFPYGPVFEPSRCQAGSYDHPGPGGRSTAPAGGIPGCEGGLPRLYDMGGNVSEWVSDCKGDYCKFRGAAFVGNEPVEYFAGCGDVCSGNDKGLKSRTVGVRCCRDRQP